MFSLKLVGTVGHFQLENLLFRLSWCTPYPILQFVPIEPLRPSVLILSLPMPEPVTEYTVTNPLCDNVLGICFVRVKVVLFIHPAHHTHTSFWFIPPSLPPSTLHPPTLFLFDVTADLLDLNLCMCKCTVLHHAVDLPFFFSWNPNNFDCVTLFSLLEIFSICLVCSWEGCGSRDILPVTAFVFLKIFLFSFFFFFFSFFLFFCEGEGVWFCFVFSNMGSIHVLQFSPF